jgi:hypothetical protein
MRRYTFRDIFPIQTNQIHQETHCIQERIRSLIIGDMPRTSEWNNLRNDIITLGTLSLQLGCSELLNLPYNARRTICIVLDTITETWKEIFDLLNSHWLRTLPKRQYGAYQTLKCLQKQNLALFDEPI